MTFNTDGIIDQHLFTCRQTMHPIQVQKDVYSATFTEIYHTVFIDFVFVQSAVYMHAVELTPMYFGSPARKRCSGLLLSVIVSISVTSFAFPSESVLRGKHR